MTAFRVSLIKPSAQGGHVRDIHHVAKGTFHNLMLQLGVCWPVRFVGVPWLQLGHPLFIEQRSRKLS